MNNEHITENSIIKQLSSLPLKPGKNPPILLFCDWCYREILDNWLTGAARLKIDNVMIIALDIQLHDYCTQIGIPCAHVKSTGDLGDLWRLRISVFKYLIDRGIDFIHSDADAVWLRDPLPEYFFGFKELSMLFSQGTIWPSRVQKLWGFVLCCGLFMMRSKPATRKFLEKLDESVQKTGDDQVSVNEVLAVDGVNWRLKSRGTLTMKDHTIVFSDHVAIGNHPEMQIGLLPFRKFPRLQIKNDSPYVSHILTPKEAQAKKEVMRKAGLWLLDGYRG